MASPTGNTNPCTQYYNRAIQFYQTSLKPRFSHLQASAVDFAKNHSTTVKIIEQTGPFMALAASLSYISPSGLSELVMFGTGVVVGRYAQNQYMLAKLQPHPPRTTQSSQLNRNRVAPNTILLASPDAIYHLQQFILAASAQTTPGQPMQSPSVRSVSTPLNNLEQHLNSDSSSDSLSSLMLPADNDPSAGSHPSDLEQAPNLPIEENQSNVTYLPTGPNNGNTSAPVDLSTQADPSTNLATALPEGSNPNQSLTDPTASQLPKSEESFQGNTPG